jgi:hypothetical protein
LFVFGDCRDQRKPTSASGSRSASTFDDLGDFIKMRIDLISQIVELTPGLAKLRRLMRRLQEFAILPLDVVDDAPPVEAFVVTTSGCFFTRP